MNTNADGERTAAGVIYPCLVSIAMILFMGAELLLWQFSDSYPATLAQVRYVNDERFLTPQAIREICNQPLTQPQLTRKRNGLFLRCGMPGIEGLYQIKLYNG